MVYLDKLEHVRIPINLVNTFWNTSPSLSLVDTKKSQMYGETVPLKPQSASLGRWGGVLCVYSRFIWYIYVDIQNYIPVMQMYMQEHVAFAIWEKGSELEKGGEGRGGWGGVWGGEGKLLKLD